MMKRLIVITILVASAIQFLPVEADAQRRIFRIFRRSVATTAFYVDPDFAGGTKNGQAATPWSVLDAGAWSTINTQLASTNVTIYFSARDAGADTDDDYGAGVEVTNRSDSSTHRLTFDGRSNYNTNDGSPSWSVYAGTKRSKVDYFNSQNAGHTKYSYITIDGFRIERVANGKAVAICGDQWILTNNDIYHTDSGGANDGPLVLIVPTANAANEGSSEWCARSSNIQITNNTIHDSSGELIYVGGAGCSVTDATGLSNCDGFPSHFSITISGNTLYNGAAFGHEGDGIDVKAGISSLTISDNDISAATASGERCIVMQGARSTDSDQDVVIQRNYCHDTPANGDAGIALVNSWGTPRGVTIRNNIIDTITGAGGKNGITIYDCQANCTVSNNTIYSVTGYALNLACAVANCVVSKNNIALSATSGPNSDFGTITQTHNAYSGTWSGTCTSCVSGLTTSDLMNAAGGNFQLATPSAARDAGTTLVAFSTDYAGTTRPQGAAWDIGAYEN